MHSSIIWKAYFASDVQWTLGKGEANHVSSWRAVFGITGGVKTRTIIGAFATRSVRECHGRKVNCSCHMLQQGLEKLWKTLASWAWPQALPYCWVAKFRKIRRYLADRRDCRNSWDSWCDQMMRVAKAAPYGPVLRLSTPPHGLGPQVAAPIPFYLQAIGSISEVQLRIC